MSEIAETFGGLGSKSRDSEKYKNFLKFYGIELLPFISDLSRKQVRGIAKVLLINKIIKQEFKVDLGLNAVVTDVLSHLVSVDRLGRKEGVKVFKSELQEVAKTQNRLQRLLSLA